MNRNMPEFANAKVKVGWNYDAGVFAALIPTDPVYRSIKYLGNLAIFLQDIRNKNPNHKFISFLQDKVLVTSVVQCTSYSQFFTDGRAGSTYAAFFDVKSPDGKFGWILKGVSGQSAMGRYTPGVWQYTPMVRLRAMEDVLRMGRCAMEEKLSCECGGACEGTASRRAENEDEKDEFEEDFSIESAKIVPAPRFMNVED